MAPTSLDGARWVVAERDRATEQRLQSELGVTPALAASLVARGHEDPAAAERFLRPELSHLHSPWALPDIRAAVDVLAWARETRARVYVHGDYDVDGVTSAALFTRFLRKIGVEVAAHVPHRLREGYGIHESAIEEAREFGAKVFLTCDCGIGAVEQVKAAREAGMRVVVTDHHQTPDQVPDAHAVVNPQRSSHQYPWKELSGVGVALKVAAALAEEIGAPVEKFYRAYLDLAALGTIADLMPLCDENRVIASLGLGRLSETQKPGLRALIAVAGLASEPRITARHVGFVLGPRINAVGRIEEPDAALRLLLSDDPQECASLAQHLDSVNERRKEEQRAAVDSAIAEVKSREDGLGPIVFVASEEWHAGIVGLIAGRLVERFRRPAFAARIEGGLVKGSARSLPGFDVGRTLQALRPLLVSGGGHELAAGFTLEQARMDEFQAALAAAAQSVYDEGAFAPTVAVEAWLAPDEASPEVGRELAQLEPFGPGNPKPVYAVPGVRIAGWRRTTNPEHCRLTLDSGGRLVTAMAFGLADAVSELGEGATVDAAFEFDEDNYNGNSCWRWIVRHIRAGS
jgi:single-stranded-DNA-specific exonuclease